MNRPWNVCNGLLLWTSWLIVREHNVVFLVKCLSVVMSMKQVWTCSPHTENRKCNLGSNSLDFQLISWLIFKVRQEFSYLLAGRRTQNPDELKRCFLMNLPLIVPLAATQTGSVVSQNSVSHNFLLTPSLGCLIESETCSHTFQQSWTWC